MAFDIPFVGAVTVSLALSSEILLYFEVFYAALFVLSHSLC